MSFPYNTIEKEYIPCNFCKNENYHVMSTKGKDGLRLNSVICKICGLIFINPRMTKSSYGLYYEQEYRDKSIVNGDMGSGFDCKKLFDSTIRHGYFLAEFIKPYLKVEGSIMEVGSGVGGVLEGIRQKINREVIGLEPSFKESEYANSKGIVTHNTLIEDYLRVERCAVIISTQSLNHFLDPRYFLEWSHKSLVDGGIILIEVMNFREQLYKAGKINNAVKIDHVYMFTPEVLRDFVKSAGFEILVMEVDEYKKKPKTQGIPSIHIRIIGRKLNVVPFKKIIIDPNNYFRTLLLTNKYIVYAKYFLFTKIPRILMNK